MRCSERRKYVNRYQHVHEMSDYVFLPNSMLCNIPYSYLTYVNNTGGTRGSSIAWGYGACHRDFGPGDQYPF